MRATLFALGISFLSQSYAQSNILDAACPERFDESEVRAFTPTTAPDGSVQNLLIKNLKKDKVPFIQRRPPGSETAEEFRINWQDTFEDTPSGIVLTKSSLGVLSGKYDRKSNTSKFWLTTLDRQTYAPGARTLLIGQSGLARSTPVYRLNQWLHSADRRFVALITGLADENSTEHEIVIMNDNLEVVKRESLHSSSSRTRIASSFLTETGDLLLLMRTGAERKTRTTAAPSDPWDLVLLGPDHATPIRTTLDIDGHLVDNVTFSHIRGGSIVLAGVKNWAAPPVAFCGELDLKAIAKGQGQMTDWREAVINLPEGQSTPDHTSGCCEMVWQPTLSDANTMYLVGQRFSEHGSSSNIAGKNVYYLNYTTSDILVLQWSIAAGGFAAVSLRSAITTDWSLVKTTPLVHLGKSGTLHILTNENDKLFDSSQRSPWPYSFTETSGSTYHRKIDPSLTTTRSVLASADANRNGVLTPWQASVDGAGRVVIPRERYSDPIKGFCSFYLE